MPYSYDDNALAELFSKYGSVESAVVIRDRMSGRSKGFGFVEIDDTGADQAMNELNSVETEGRMLKVSEARPQVDRN